MRVGKGVGEAEDAFEERYGVAHEFFAADRFFFQQVFRQFMQFVDIFSEDLARLFMGAFDDVLHFRIDLSQRRVQNLVLKMC